TKSSLNPLALITRVTGAKPPSGGETTSPYVAAVTAASAESAGDSPSVVPVARRLSVPLPTAPSENGTATESTPPAAITTDAGIVPHWTGPVAVHCSANVFVAFPVFLTANLVECPPVLACRSSEAVPAVTSTPYDAISTVYAANAEV